MDNEVIVETDQPALRPAHEVLSDRELEVLRLLASGLTPAETAERLRLSIKSLSTYRCRILEKMGLKNTAEIMEYATGAGIEKIIPGGTQEELGD